MHNWIDLENILCIRLDNMGDLLMSSPAINALKETFRCKITLLTSSMAGNIAHFIPSIDEVIAFDVPWVKLSDPVSSDSIIELVDILREKRFDAAVVFTVFSQNPMPAIMLAYMAAIPLRLAYCRENPYQLLTNWLSEEEPYYSIRHQVRRDLDLVRSVGATIGDEHIVLSTPDHLWEGVKQKLSAEGLSVQNPWMLLHPGVSEQKREYPVEQWIETGRKIVRDLNYQVVLTGSSAERSLTERIQSGIDRKAYSMAGRLNLEEFIIMIKQAPLVISVNTSTIHIAAATGTPVVVMYALTNPQHTPWKVRSKVLPFTVPKSMESKNEVLRYVRDNYFPKEMTVATPDEVVEAAIELLNGPAVNSDAESSERLYK